MVKKFLLFKWSFPSQKQISYYFNGHILSAQWISLGLPCSSNGKESACNAGDPCLIPGLGRSSGEGNGHPLQYSCLGDSHRQRSLEGYSLWGPKKSDMTEQLTHTLKLSLAWKITLLQNESEIDWDNLLFGMFGSETSCYSFLPVH